jgi:hypothetical protein
MYKGDDVAFVAMTSYRNLKTACAEVGGVGKAIRTLNCLGIWWHDLELSYIGKLQHVVAHTQSFHI